MQPLVSVIMPAYNAEKYIADAVRSLSEQTFTDWELIVVDDGSSDRTAAIVKELAGRDSRINYIFRQNAGQGPARNTAIKNAQAFLVAFLDADDLWVSDKLEKQISAIDATGADVIYSSGLIFEDDPKNATNSFEIVEGFKKGIEMLDLLLLHNSIPVQSVIIRREVVDRVGGFEESRDYRNCEDYDLWLKAAKSGALFYGMPEKLIRYRRHSSAATSKDSEVLKPMLRVVMRHVIDSHLSPSAKKHRIRGLYRRLISALIAEEKISEAQEYMRELSGWDKAGIVTSIQRPLLRVAPRCFNFISRECLYRTEWHLNRLSGHQ